MEGFKKIKQNPIEYQQPNMEELMQKVVEEAEKLEIKERDRNKEGELLVSPDGQVSNLGKQSELWWKITRTETFKTFFGDWQNDPKNSSKILDKNSEPIVLFRGMNGSITISDFYRPEAYQGKDNETGRVSLGRKGVYATSVPKIAEQYGDQVYPFFANARHPKYPGQINAFIDEMKDIKNQLIFLVSKKLFKDVPKPSSQEEKYDVVIGEKYLDQNSNSKDAENVYQILIKDPKQLLLIPNPTKKVKESITT